MGHIWIKQKAPHAKNEPLNTTSVAQLRSLGNRVWGLACKVQGVGCRVGGLRQREKERERETEIERKRERKRDSLGLRGVAPERLGCEVLGFEGLEMFGVTGVGPRIYGSRSPLYPWDREVCSL